MTIDTNVRYLTFEELRELLRGRGRTTVYRDVEAGRLPRPIKLGSRLYWNAGDVHAAIQSIAG